MKTVRMLNTAGEIDQIILAAHHSNDTAILRGRDGGTWVFGPEHYPHRPEAGWGASVAHHGPFIVLWEPGSVLVPAGTAALVQG